MHLRQIFAGEAHYLGIQFGDHDPRNARMPEQLPRCAAVAATQHERGARCGMGQRIRVDHAFVIDELVADGGHRTAVEREEPPELRGVPDFDLLVGRGDAHEAPRVWEAVQGVRSWLEKQRSAQGGRRAGGRNRLTIARIIESKQGPVRQPSQPAATPPAMRFPAGKAATIC